MGFSCSECGRDFESQEALSQHKNAKHYVAPARKSFDAADFALKNWKKLFGLVIFLAIAFVAAKALQSPTNARLGAVGSEHSHADFKVYVNGLPADFNKPKYDHVSPYSHMHLDTGGGSSLIHKHATGTPFYLFLQSLGWRVSSGCLSTDENKSYCPDASTNSSLKFFVNKKQRSDLEAYVLADGDKILLTYGSGEAAQLEFELDSITDFAAQARAGLIGG